MVAPPYMTASAARAKLAVVLVWCSLCTVGQRQAKVKLWAYCIYDSDCLHMRLDRNTPSWDMDMALQTAVHEHAVT